MSLEAPPRWLERALILLLEGHDRETISGDLLEEYREEKLPTLGRARANYWYLRQLISFVSIQIRGGGLLKQVLVWICFFTVVAGIWLGVMENVLRHHGYVGRSVIAACIAVQSLGTLLAIRNSSGTVFRTTLMAGAAAIVILGASAVWNNAHAQHFEGFAVVIGAALLVQGGLTLAAFLRVHSHTQPG